MRPEVVDNYELGVKSRFLSDRAEANLTLFWTDDQDYQANYINYLVTPNRSYISNIGDVRSRGVEIDTRATPVKGLNIGLSATYNDAIYKTYENAPPQYLNTYLGHIDLSGRPASGASKYAATANAEYAYSFDKTELYLGGDVSYRSGFYAAVNLDPFSWVKEYTLVGLHAGVRDPGGKWDLTLWARNLLRSRLLQHQIDQ